jgi:hypothetical protein
MLFSWKCSSIWGYENKKYQKSLKCDWKKQLFKWWKTLKCDMLVKSAHVVNEKG